MPNYELCHVTPNYTEVCQAFSSYVKLPKTISCAGRCHSRPCHASLYQTMPAHPTSCRTMRNYGLCRAMSYATLCLTAPGYFELCETTLNYAEL